MLGKLILNDGTEITGYLIVSGDKLLLYMYDFGFQNAFEALSDPENVKSIKWERNGEKGTVKGFKHLYTVTEENDTLTTAGLRK